MPLILMIAAGILLAVVLLPFLGPLVLLALGVGAIGELLTAAKLRGLPGLWHGHILRERFGNCCHAGLFRVEDGLNRRQLEKYLQTAAARCAGPDADRGEALSRQILACYDRLCAAHVPKK